MPKRNEIVKATGGSPRVPKMEEVKAPQIRNDHVVTIIDQMKVSGDQGKPFGTYRELYNFFKDFTDEKGNPTLISKEEYLDAAFIEMQHFLDFLGNLKVVADTIAADTATYSNVSIFGEQNAKIFVEAVYKAINRGATNMSQLLNEFSLIDVDQLWIMVNFCKGHMDPKQLYECLAYRSVRDIEKLNEIRLKDGGQKLLAQGDANLVQELGRHVTVHDSRALREQVFEVLAKSSLASVADKVRQQPQEHQDMFADALVRALEAVRGWDQPQTSGTTSQPAISEEKRITHGKS